MRGSEVVSSLPNEIFLGFSLRLIEPYKGRVYDQCCGSGDMFVQTERFIEEPGGKKENVIFYWPGIKSDYKGTLQDI
jgi:type I restriction-modification system DNA methylase subunit